MVSTCFTLTPIACSRGLLQICADRYRCSMTGQTHAGSHAVESARTHRYLIILQRAQTRARPTSARSQYRSTCACISVRAWAAGPFGHRVTSPSWPCGTVRVGADPVCTHAPTHRLHESRSVCRANGALALSVHLHELLPAPPEPSPDVYGSERLLHGQIADASTQASASRQDHIMAIAPRQH